MRWLGRPVTVPRWAAGVASLGAVGIGVALGLGLDGGDDDGSGRVLSGVIDSVDDEGALCIGAGRAGKVECYRSPGFGLKVGDAISFRVRAEPIDPDDPGLGKQLVIVWAARR